jgi:hypothetical protein
MACCGQKRAALAVKGGAGAPSSGGTVRFSYAGARLIVVRGTVTGRSYRFVPGGFVHVHSGDAQAMREIPGLKAEPVAEQFVA